LISREMKPFCTISAEGRMVAIPNVHCFWRGASLRQHLHRRGLRTRNCVSDFSAGPPHHPVELQGR
jgi:hypothetical protein